MTSFACPTCGRLQDKSSKTSFGNWLFRHQRLWCGRTKEDRRRNRDQLTSEDDAQTGRQIRPRHEISLGGTGDTDGVVVGVDAAYGTGDFTVDGSVPLSKDPTLPTADDDYNADPKHDV